MPGLPFRPARALRICAPMQAYSAPPQDRREAMNRPRPDGGSPLTGEPHQRGMGPAHPSPPDSFRQRPLRGDGQSRRPAITPYRMRSLSRT